MESLPRASCLYFRSFALPCANECSCGFISAPSLQMTFKLPAPFFHDADGRHGRGVAERTEGSPQHVFGKIRDELDVFLTPQTGVEALQCLPQPRGTFAARNAPPARFVGIEVHDT